MKRRIFAALLSVSFGFIVISDLPPYAAGLMVVGAWALAVMVVLLVRELTEVSEERRHSAWLAGWIHAHHPGTSYAPYDGDEAGR